MVVTEVSFLTYDVGHAYMGTNILSVLKIIESQGYLLGSMGSACYYIILILSYQLEARFLEQSSTNLYCILEREISCTTANSRAYLRIIYEHHKSILKPLLVVAVHPPGNGKLTSIYRTSDEQFTGEIVRLKKISFQSVASATCVENNLRTKYNISLKSL